MTRAITASSPANRPFLSEVAPLEDCLTEDPIQVMFTGGCAEMRSLFDRLRAEHCSRFSVALTEYEHRDFSLVDVVRRVVPRARHFGVGRAPRLPATEVMAIGDNLNDCRCSSSPGRPSSWGTRCQN